MSTGQHDIYTHSDTFSIVVDHYGDARGTKSQFAKSDPSTIDPLINENLATYHLATDHLTTSLSSIRSSLEACWTGSSADHALGILTTLSSNATTIGTNAKACHDSFVQFQQSWTSCKNAAGNLYEGVGGSGVHEDNSGAHRVYAQFNQAMQDSMHSMPAHLRYSQPLDAQHAGSPGPVPGPGGGPGGYGPGGYGPGPGSYGPGPGNLTSYQPGAPGGPGSPGPGSGQPGPGTYHGGNGGYGPGSGSGSGTGPGPGSGLNTGSQLSGYTGGGMGAPGPGPGFGPGPGGVVTGASGLSGSTAGLGAVGAGAGIGGVGAAEGEAGATAGRSGLGRGMGAAGNDDEDERDRTTWLSEEEGIWDGETAAPPGIIA